MQDSPIEAAETLVRELRQKHHRDVISAIAIHQREESAICLERLIQYIRGYRDGTREEISRLVRAASGLLSQISKLHDALDARKRLGLMETERDRFIRDFVTGSAPRLWELADRLRNLIESPDQLSEIAHAKQRRG
jgi:hypothetical protein